MSSVDKATETQLKNIQKKTGKSLTQLFAILSKSKLAKHGELRSYGKESLDLGYGDANLLAAVYLKSLMAADAADSASGDADADPLDTIYVADKAPLRPIHEKLMTAISKFGAFEIAPKKGYVSLRRKKQFAMIGPATKSRVEVGLNMKDAEPNERLIKLPAGGMCQYKVNVSDLREVDKALIVLIKQAYDAAG